MTRHVPRQARAPISERPAEPLPVQCLAVPGGDAMRFSVGIDWASAAHAVCILDQTGRVHLAAQRIALANQLRALLERFWPGAAAIFADVDSPIALAFLARYPTPDSAARLGEQRLAQFLGQHAYCGRRPVAELLARLRRAPTSQVGAAEADASGDVVRALIAVLSPLVAHLQQLSAAIAAALAQHPDGPLVQSLPRSGAVNAAQILAELGDDRARFPTDEQFAAEAGLAPVTHASGQHRAVVFRWAII